MNHIPTNVLDWSEAALERLQVDHGLSISTLVGSDDPVAMVLAAGMGEATLRALLAQPDEEEVITCIACQRDVPRDEALFCNGYDEDDPDGCHVVSCSDCVGIVFDGKQDCEHCGTA